MNDYKHSHSLLMFPKIIFGTSSLGNLYQASPYQDKKAVINEIIARNSTLAMFDSAGKYGAGLALESLGKALTDLNVDKNNIIISNKLGWKQTPLLNKEPTFEKDVWKELNNDAVQDISYDGIMECYEQGNLLLGQYQAEVVSIHDPDEYLALATDEQDKSRRQADLLDGYKALQELKDSGHVRSIGVGAKDLTVIDFISEHIQLDWAMFANSITPYTHTEQSLQLIDKLAHAGTPIINSAVFNAGFLVGGHYLNYQKVTIDNAPEAFAWRNKFHAICKQFDVTPALACVQFSFLFENIVSVALNTSSAKRIEQNITLANTPVPTVFWQALQEAELISPTLSL